MVDFGTSLDFISLNTVPKLKFDFAQRFSTFIGLGLRLDYLVSYDEKIELLKLFEDVNELNRLLLGIIGVAGINVDLNNFQIGVEFHYNYDLNRIVDYKSQWDIENRIRIDYYTVAFSYGYKIK